MKIRKIIPSETSRIPEIEEWVLNSISELKLSEEKSNLIGMAVSEAISNSIIHGNKSDPNKKVEVTIELIDEKLIITFKDEGNGFIPEDVPDPTLPENMMKESGRGIHIMKTIIDDVKYNFTEDGTELVLTINMNKE
ncbi:MAG: ATP-binding protein [Ignavibacteria bacterium]|nr:MAG: ATP-binding protein [Ignavibacteria bacterium]